MEQNKAIPELNIVVPVFNEEPTIRELYERISSAASAVTDKYELILINDGSSDKTPELLKHYASVDKRVKYISFSRNFGHQEAISAGLMYAKAKAVVIIDGDLQDPPELIPELYKKYKEGYKVVYAKRAVRKDELLYKKVAASIFYRILSKLTSVDIPLDTGDFRLVSHEVVNAINNMGESNKFLRGQIAWLGFRQTFVEFDRQGRKHGDPKYTLRKLVRLALNGITSFSDVPLKLASVMGFMFSVVAFLVIIYALYSKFVGKDIITGWASIIVSTMFIGGIQLLSIGIIGEYIGRINKDVRKRPLYVIEESNIQAG